VTKSHGSVVGTATAYRLDNQVWSSSPSRVDNCHFSISSIQTGSGPYPLDTRALSGK
jgi:hypothetical protein